VDTSLGAVPPLGIAVLEDGATTRLRLKDANDCGCGNMTDSQSFGRSVISTAARATERRESRRGALVDAAFGVFLEKGVAASSVDDIVEAAGVAKGTFYLYFRTKDDAINAVAERIVDGVAGVVEAAAATPGLSPVDRLLTLGRSVGQVGAAPNERELIEVFHRPENRAIHDRLMERIVARLVATVESIVSDGIAQGQFAKQDPHLAAGFVLATFTSLHDLVGSEAGVERVAAELNAFILRGLGCEARAAR
jgi:AcrR family transcriptional regulator